MGMGYVQGPKAKGSTLEAGTLDLKYPAFTLGPGKVLYYISSECNVSIYL